MTIRHFKIFLKVYTTRSMTAAAKDLFITQPTVSQAIRELEEHYHVRLFDRLYHRLYPTSAGEELYRNAVRIVSMFDEVEDSLTAKMHQHRITLGLFPSAGMIARRWTAEFSGLYPATEIRVLVQESAVLREMLRTANLDLAVLDDHSVTDDLIQEVFARDQLAALVPPDHPLLKLPSVPVDLLLRQPLLLSDKRASLRLQLEEQVKLLGLKLDPVWESSSDLVLLDACRKGLGIALLPRMMVQEDLETGRLCALPVTGIDLSRNLAITWHKDRYISSTMSDLMEIIRKSAVSPAP